MDKIRDYVEDLFAKGPKNKRKEEVKEEMIQDLEEKYSDLIKSGVSAKKAYNDVIAGIGDIDEILSQINGSSISENIYYEEILKRKKVKGLVYSISIFLYIMAIVAVAVASELELPDYVSISSFLIIVGIATSMIVYYTISTPKLDEEEVVVAKRSTKASKDEKLLKNAISGILWPLIVAIYLIISFVFSNWYISWIIFIIGSAIEQIILLAVSIRGDKND